LLDVHEQRYGNAEMLKRLDCLLTNTNEVEPEIKARIIADNKCYLALGRTLKGRYIAQSLRQGLYKTIKRSIVTCGADGWTLMNKMETPLMTWGRKILRKMFGRTHENVYSQ
jgi:hypothetical protein